MNETQFTMLCLSGRDCSRQTRNELFGERHLEHILTYTPPYF